jgi:hypothetical protein
VNDTDHAEFDAPGPDHADHAPTAAAGPQQPEPSERSEQSELDLGVIATGVPAVDQALAPLEGIGERSIDEHAEIFERVLSDLSQTMTDGTDGTEATSVASASAPDFSS